MTISNRVYSLLLLLPAVAVLLLHGQAVLLSADCFPLGGQVTVRLPPAPYQPRFAARAVVLDDTQQASQRPPGFVAAVSAEARAGAYTCSLVLLLGGVKVWASDHLDKFVARALCRLELTAEDGQLRLTDEAGKVGWLSGTAGQGVKALHLDSKTGNLILVDAQNHTKWQSSDDPTDKFLRGQHHRLPVYFIASMTNEISSSPFYSFELDEDKIATYIHLGNTSYSYWELAPTPNSTMTSARLDASGLKMLNAQGTMVAQISPPVKKPPLSFLVLGVDGNLEMYYHDAQHQRFRVSYKALGFCELPLSCNIHEVCSAAGRCKDFSAYADDMPANSGGDLCYGTGGGEACMVHLRGVTTVLRAASPALANVTLRECVVQCASDLSCNAALYVKDNASVAAANDEHGVCWHYTLTVGVREVTGGSRRRYSYWVKSTAVGGAGGDGTDGDDADSSHGMLGKILMVCGAIDVVCAVVFTVLVALYFRRLRRLAATVDRAVELRHGEAAEEQNSSDSNETEHH